MKTKGRPWQFFVVAILIFLFAYSAFFGIKSQYGDTLNTWIKGAADIRFGIDIRGGVDVTFMPADGYDATDEQLEAAKAVVEQRLVNLQITDSEVYADSNKDRIVVRFPWKENETEFDPEAAIQEIGATARLTFREGKETDSEGMPSGITAENIILEGEDIKSATAQVDTNSSSATYGEYYVALELNDSGKEKFAEATERLSGESPKGVISIWMDDTMISYPQVQTAITDGHAQISLGGSDDATREQAVTLANQINSGALPFALEAENFSTISPSLGANSLDAMVLAGVIAFVLVALFMILNYRLPGFVAAIALLGQTAMTLAFVSGYFAVFPSFTLTLPGIAGIILAIGMGVDANVITAERIKEEIRAGKSIDGALNAGFRRGLKPIIDGNVSCHCGCDADGRLRPHRRHICQAAAPCVFRLWRFYRGHYLFLWLHASGRCAAEFCVWCWLHTRDASRYIKAQMHAQRGFVRRPQASGAAKAGKNLEHRGGAQKILCIFAVPCAVHCNFQRRIRRENGYPVQGRRHDIVQLRGRGACGGCDKRGQGRLGQ